MNNILPFFAHYIEENLGIVYEEHNYFQLQSRLEDLAKKFSISSLEELHKMAQKGLDPKMNEYLLSLATNNETFFFRDTKVFDAIKDIVFESAQSCNGREFLAWSAACSSGQEPLSLSMILVESLKDSVGYKIYATDVSHAILAKAKNALYSEFETSRGLTTQMRDRFFRQSPPSSWKPSDEIMKHISYQYLNLKAKRYDLPQFDLILCRNVLIYQRPEGKKAILSAIIDHLRPGGHLVLGAGESLLGISDQLKRIIINGVVIYKKI